MCLSFAATIRSRRFRSCFALQTGQRWSHGRAGAELSTSIGEDVNVFNKGLGWTSICRINIWLKLYITMNFTRKMKDCIFVHEILIHIQFVYTGSFCCSACQLASCKAKMVSYYPMSSWPLTFLACQHLRYPCCEGDWPLPLSCVNVVGRYLPLSCFQRPPPLLPLLLRMIYLMKF